MVVLANKMLHMKEDLRKKISQVLNVSIGKVNLNNPEKLSFGDYSTNIALVLAKEEDKNPQELAISFAAKLMESNLPNVLKVEVATPGFINFHLSRNFFAESIEKIINEKVNFGKIDLYKGKKIIVEYTDPNVLKPFHIGHLMSNSIGESISRMFEKSGGSVVRINYYSDSGLNIAMAVFGMEKLQAEMPADTDLISSKIAYLAKAYPYGVKQYAENNEAKAEIENINKIIQNKEKGNSVYDLYLKGKETSLQSFEEIYKTLDSTFDILKAESEVAEVGKKVVNEFLLKEIFEKGKEGAIIFPGEKHGLHTRVFINKHGFGTYEAKELGLTKFKFETEDPDLSVVVTANEQNDYFKVVFAAIRSIKEEWATKTKHIGHGILRLPSGKMSSRTGDVISALSLINDVKEKVLVKMEGREIEDKDLVAEQIAIGAIKYSILKQSPGKDIIFDFDKSLSFEGDSGPYLQYSAVRANSVLEKAQQEGVKLHGSKFKNVPEEMPEVERLLPRFPEIVERAAQEFAPQLISAYLIQLAGAFNAYYGKTKIFDDRPESAYRLAITEAVKIVLTNGLSLLAIKVPKQM